MQVKVRPNDWKMLISAREVWFWLIKTEEELNIHKTMSAITLSSVTLFMPLSAGKTLDLAVAENVALSKPRVYHFCRVTMYLSTEPPGYAKGFLKSYAVKQRSDDDWACPEDIQKKTIHATSTHFPENTCMVCTNPWGGNT